MRFRSCRFDSIASMTASDLDAVDGRGGDGGSMIGIVRSHDDSCGNEKSENQDQFRCGG